MDGWIRLALTGGGYAELNSANIRKLLRRGQGSVVLTHNGERLEANESYEQVTELMSAADFRSSAIWGWEADDG